MLGVENVGAGPASDVKLSLQPDFALRPGTMLSEAGLFQHGIRYLGPKQRISTFLTSMIDQVAEIEKPDGKFRFTVSAKYRDMLGKEHTAECPIDFLQFLGLTRIGTPALRSIADDMEKLRRSVANLETGWKRLRVETYTARDREEERAALGRV